MAFKTSYTHLGYTYAEAYVKAYIAHCNTQVTRVCLNVYPNAAIRHAGHPPVAEIFIDFETSMSMQADNPLEYAYTKLEQSGLYPDATWNI